MILTKLRKDYPKSKSGEFIKFKDGKGNIACCDCGLVHSYVIIKKGNDYYLKAKNDELETERLRKNKYGYLQQAKLKKGHLMI